jgi:hypothetical protein
MFYGLIVTMYYLDTKQHKLPHIHVKYNVDRNTPGRINGKLATCINRK